MRERALVNVLNLTNSMPVTNKYAKALQLLGSILFIIAAGYFFIFALNAIYNYGIHPLFADQWRIYTVYFNKPFPQNIFAIQNGHHPIIPGLFFLLDLNLFQGKQTFLLIAGTTLAVITAIGILWPMIKSSHLTFLHKSVAIYIVFSGMFWLGNHRILLHANESVHAYLVTVFLLAALGAITICRISPKKRAANIWCVVACILSQLAVFSFGSGIAVPPMLLLIALLMRLPVFQLSILATNTIVTVLIYLILPNANGVAGVLVSSVHHIKQLINIFYLAGAPLAFLFSPQFSFQQTAPWIKDYLCPISGGLGFSLLYLKVAWLLYKKELSVRLEETNVLGLAIFCSLTIILVAIMRANFFITSPQQIFANRYLLWSNLFWISMGLIMINEISTCKNKLLKKVSCAFLLIGCTLTGFFIHHNNITKMLAIENWRNSIQLAAASLAVGVHDDKLIEQGLREPPTEVYALSQKLQARQLNIFAYPVAQNMGKNINKIYAISNNSSPGRLIIERVFKDLSNHSLSANINGYANLQWGKNIHGILVTTQTGIITGIATIQTNRYKPSQKYSDFSGYIKNYDSEMKYRIYAIMEKKREAMSIDF